MTRADGYNWFLLDRYLVAEMLYLLRPSLVQVKKTPVEISSIIKRAINFFEIPVNIRTCYKKETKLQHVYVGGFYFSLEDKNRRKPITIVLQYNNNDKDSPITLDNKDFKKLCMSIADTLMHEIMHLRQYRRRKFKDIPGYESTARLAKKRNEQIYLGHDDEIDAYSFNIACQLNDLYRGDKNKVVAHLQKSKKDGRVKNTCYKMYMEAFDYDGNHRVIKKIKRKVMRYLPYAKELGKPYKTNDWLKM